MSLENIVRLDIGAFWNPLGGIMDKAQVVIMEGVGHLPMIEKPRETAEIYMSFLRQKK